MKVSNNYFTTSGYTDKNKEGIAYNVILLYNHEILLFSGMFWGNEKDKGDICISNDTLLKYCRVGNWEKRNSMIELKIRGKGIFYAIDNNNLEYNIHEAEAENSLEKLAIDAIKNLRNECF